MKPLNLYDQSPGMSAPQVGWPVPAMLMRLGMADASILMTPGSAAPNPASFGLTLPYLSPSFESYQVPLHLS